MLNCFEDATEKWKTGKSNYWILINSEEIDNIKDVLDLDEESIIECRNIRQISRINFYDQYIFLVCNVLYYDSKDVKSHELNIFLSKDYILTIYKDNLDILTNLIKDISELKNCLILKERPEPSILLYYILDRIIIRNYDVISKLEALADKIEINILKNPEHEQIDELIHLRRQVFKIRKYLNPLRYIGDSILSNENCIIEKESLKSFKGLNNKIDKLMLALESLVQDLALVREAFESEIANKTNELMKVFTLIATIFLPLNLITSMYGMNFKMIPLNNCEYGYYFIVISMIIISLALIFLFKRKKWL